jgi:hypothetical protein
MRILALLCAVVLVPIVIMGCGGDATQTGTTSFPARGPEIAQTPTTAQVAAAYAAAGKAVPDFLTEAAPASTSRALMTALTLSIWSSSQSVASGRTSWYEANCTSTTHPYDAYIDWISGDPDLFVFSPMRWSGTRLQLIGYSIGGVGSDEHVGSWYASRYGTGRYIIAVYGYTSSSYRVGFD